MFEKFTEGAIKVIMLAQEEARRMGHNFVGTEQLLLGVIGQRHGIGGRALAQINVTLKKTRKEIEKYIGRGTGFVASCLPSRLQTPKLQTSLRQEEHPSRACRHEEASSSVRKDGSQVHTSGIFHVLEKCLTRTYSKPPRARVQAPKH